MIAYAEPVTVTTASPLVVAHRGSAQQAIENTLPAFQQAIQDGADVLELDIHLTRDQDLAVIHDDTLERTHNHPGEVRKMSSDELRALGVPMLNDVLAMAPIPLFIEIKHPKGGRHEGIEQVLVDQLEAAGADARSVVISFDETSLKKLHELDPEISTGYLYSGRPIDLAAKKDELSIDYVSPHFAGVHGGLIAEAHALGLKVNPWTVNRPADQQRMIRLGADAITTDQAAQLNDLVG